MLGRAQAEGSLELEQDARALARFFVGVAHGLNAVNKVAPDPAMLKDMVKIAMGVWGIGVPNDAVRRAQAKKMPPATEI